LATKFKTFLAIVTSLILVFALWTIKNQMKTVVFALVLGITGTILIFITEFAYSSRKSGAVKFGKVKRWLSVHIFIGITGPLIIIVHTRLNIGGFAGWLLLLTVVVVASGFAGRYIFRQIPRSIKGQEMTLAELNAVFAEIDGRLNGLLEKSPRAAQLVKILRAQFGEFAAPGAALGDADGKSPGLWLYFTSTIDWSIGRLKVRRLLAGQHPEEHVLMQTLKGLEFERLALERRVRLLGTSKKLFAQWKILHVPLTMALFVGILIHVGGILYYGKALP